ncbi:hypothetical protein [Methylobacterium brachythecii]|uniref:Uncharacterized protein n=1 Tax=Methylobacterium brachythecii TaxID=1176177 RepID=A0A7W6AKG6_9HYPH|nr:hypothetical protein [Methylobacterium brachythecii]MBB3902895.1 hypothetical protein [Methylobacterium brachythecii]GLS43822.1 hypothetical protein GCM10007884_18070 [Methylobacterium brachythecii]
MKRFVLTKTELDERSFGSPFDPLLHGVAQGLANLFPPIETVRLPQSEEEALRWHEAADELTDE